MGFALGHKIDARFKELEAKCAALDAKADEILTKYFALLERVDALEAKRGPGRPKATDGK